MTNNYFNPPKRPWRAQDAHKRVLVARNGWNNQELATLDYLQELYVSVRNWLDAIREEIGTHMAEE